MRSFGTDSPEFLCFTLGKSKKIHRIPLAASLPAPVLVEMHDAYASGDEGEALKFQLSLIERYVGEDAAASLTMGDVQAIFSAWTEESRGQGAEPGE